MRESEYFDEIARLWPERGQNASEQLVDICWRAVAEYPASSIFWYDLGIVIQRYDGDNVYTPADYRLCFENAVKHDPAAAEAFQELGYVLDVYYDDFENAAELLRKAIELGAGAESYYGLARVLAESGKVEDAFDCISKQKCPYSDDPEIETLRREIVNIWGRRGDEGKGNITHFDGRAAP